MSLLQHKKHEIKNVNELHDEQMTLGDRVADGVASVMGSWSFIITQSILLALWIFANTVAFFAHWDNYPYVLLNLALSFQAAFATPVILMSQNRQSQKDRLTVEEDYSVNRKGEQEIEQVIEHLSNQYAELLKQTNMLVQLLQDKQS